MKGPRGVRPPLSVARRPHSPLSRVPPQNSSSSQGPGMVCEERWPPDPAFPPLDARRAPHTCANARPALGALYWGRRPCPAKPAHPHAPAPPCAPCPPRLGTGVAKQDLGCCFIRTSWKNLGGPWPPRHSPLAPQRGAGTHPPALQTPPRRSCQGPCRGRFWASGSRAQPGHRQPHPRSRDGACSRHGGHRLGPTPPLGRKTTSGRASPEAKTV